jgi:hypothetical protein
MVYRVLMDLFRLTWSGSVAGMVDVAQDKHPAHPFGSSQGGRHVAALAQEFFRFPRLFQAIVSHCQRLPALQPLQMYYLCMSSQCSEVFGTLSVRVENEFLGVPSM